MRPFSPILVELLDSFEQEQCDSDPVALWQEYKEEREARLLVHFDFSLSEEEGQEQEELEQLFERTETMLSSLLEEQGDLDEFFAELLELNERSENFIQEREREHYLFLPSLDSLLCASLATLSNRGSKAAIECRLEPAKQLLKHLQATFVEIEELLPETLQNEFHQSLALTEEALKEIENSLEGELDSSFEDLLFQLKSGGEGLGDFAEFLAEIGQEEEAEEPATPILGELFEGLEENLTDELLQHYYAERLPKFFEFWDTKSATLPVDPDVLEKSYPKIEALVGQLEEQPMDSAEDETAHFELMADLEEEFQKLKEARLPVERLQDSHFEPEVDLLLGILRGEIPRLMMRTALAQMQDTDTEVAVQKLAPILAEFLETEDNLLILEALRNLADELEEIELWVTCTHCGQRSSRLQKLCQHCGQKPDVGIVG